MDSKFNHIIFCARVRINIPIDVQPSIFNSLMIIVEDHDLHATIPLCDLEKTPMMVVVVTVIELYSSISPLRLLNVCVSSISV